MFLAVFFYLAIAIVGIAVRAVMLAGIILSNINALDTAAYLPLGIILFDINRLSDDLGNDAIVDALPLSNAVLRQINFLGAGLYS